MNLHPIIEIMNIGLQKTSLYTSRYMWHDFYTYIALVIFRCCGIDLPPAWFPLHRKDGPGLHFSTGKMDLVFNLPCMGSSFPHSKIPLQCRLLTIMTTHVSPHELSVFCFLQEFQNVTFLNLKTPIMLKAENSSFETYSQGESLTPGQFRGGGGGLEQRPVQ